MTLIKYDCGHAGAVIQGRRAGVVEFVGYAHPGQGDTLKPSQGPCPHCKKAGK